MKTNTLLSTISTPLYLVAILWVIHLLKLTFHLNLTSYGLIPRDTGGLVGILTSPFLHSDLKHLSSNSIPLFILTTIILAFYRRVAVRSLLMIYLLTGIFVWLFARGDTIHIGASGVVYGLVSFVFWTGIFRRNIKSVILALIVTLLYSGYFFGVLPMQRGISWESHLLGAFVGILVAYWNKDNREEDEEDNQTWTNDEPTKYFLPRDIFDKTIVERKDRRGGF